MQQTFVALGSGGLLLLLGLSAQQPPDSDGSTGPQATLYYVLVLSPFCQQLTLLPATSIAKKSQFGPVGDQLVLDKDGYIRQECDAVVLVASAV